MNYIIMTQQNESWVYESEKTFSSDEEAKSYLQQMYLQDQTLRIAERRQNSAFIDITTF